MISFTACSASSSPAFSFADQPNALSDSPVPAGAQQNVEQAQNLPQELEPIAVQAQAPGPADEVNLFFLVRFL